MNEALRLAMSGALGGVLGLFFFGGLWWTVHKRVSAARPALWIFGSLVVRMSVTLVGFYFVSGGHWQRLLACLAGFMVARVFVTRLTREVPHAPQS